MPPSHPADHEKFMHLALDEAKRGLAHCSPNPAVGALLVRGSRVIARGFHRSAGGPHAEIEALRSLKSPTLARGATLYVTLEPCSTHGRTPPCVEAILAAGITRVVVGATDPNPKHASRGFALLRQSGVEVIHGILAEECTHLNRGFNRWIVTGMPWVIAKWAMTLDGCIAPPPGHSPRISGREAHRAVQELRSECDAILVGAETVRTDNPRLTVRGIKGARQPWRVVLSRSGVLPKSARIFTDRHWERTLLFRNTPLRKMLADLGKRGVTTLLVEGGGKVLGSFFDRDLVDEVVMFIAPKFFGGPTVAVAGIGADSNEASTRMGRVEFSRIGNDVCLRALVEHRKEAA